MFFCEGHTQKRESHKICTTPTKEMRTNKILLTVMDGGLGFLSFVDDRALLKERTPVS